MVVRQFAEYRTSQDYVHLAELAKTRSIICLVDYGGDCEDVAHTLFQSRGDEHMWHISARGHGYVFADTVAEFVDLCQRRKVRFLVPG